MSEHDIQTQDKPQERKVQLQEQLDEAEMSAIFNLMGARGGLVVTLGLTGVAYINLAQGSVGGTLVSAFVGATGAVISWNRYKAADKERHEAEDIRARLDRML